MAANKKITAICRQHFDFLMADFDMQLIKATTESWGCQLNYRGRISAVTLIFELREPYPFVKLHSLTDGTTADLDDIVELSGGAVQSPDGKTVHEILAFQADHLKIYGTAILKGDFSLFPAAAARVRERKRLT